MKLLTTPSAWCVLVLVASVATVDALSTEGVVPRLAVGERLPSLKGDLLTGEKSTLPDAAAGKVALLTLGFSYDSRVQVEAWAEQYRSRYGTQPGRVLYEVPMMGSAARLGRWFIDSGMRKGTPKELHRFVLTVYGNSDAWKARLGFSRADDAYVVLIDGQGIVRWMARGAVSPERMQELEAVIQALAPLPEGPRTEPQR
jgi:hypothetical protein